METMNILIYNDENMVYYNGVPTSIDITSNPIDFITVGSDGRREILQEATLIAHLSGFEKLENIKLDDTLMRRIAKFNKEQEIKRLEHEIENKKERIKELDDILQDKEGRIKKLKEFVANIYDIDLEDDYGI